MVKVIAEQSGLHHRGQILIGRGNDAGMNSNGFVGSQGTDFIVLERPEYLRLLLERHLRDLVEKQRTRRGRLPKAFLVGGRVSKGALFVAK